MKFYFNPPVIEIDGGFYDVNPLPIDVTSLEEGECYAFDDKVLIYRGKSDKLKGEPKVGFYLDENDKIKVHLPKGLEDIYSTKNIKEFNVSSIIDEIIEDNDAFTSPEDMEVIQNNADVTTFVIRESDDFLTRLVKSVINSKQINLKNYESKVEKSLFTNMKGSLNTEGRKMSVLYFKRWAEVLGFDYKVIVKDSGTDHLAPLVNNITYDSTDDEIEESE